jgi:hypothetical protein
VVNKSDSIINNVVLQGKGIGLVIYKIPPYGVRSVIVRPALETDIRFEYSCGEKIYYGLIDEYLTKGCYGRVTLNLNYQDGDYSWQGWLRGVLFGHRMIVSNSSTAKVIMAVPSQKQPTEKIERGSPISLAAGAEAASELP